MTNTTTTWIDTAEVAKMIRVILKKEFPATKFAVRISRYAGGSSINASWTDGPTDAQVNAKIGHMKAGSYNGMEDIYEYDRSATMNGEKVSYANGYLFTDRLCSVEFCTKVRNFLLATNSQYSDKPYAEDGSRNEGYIAMNVHSDRCTLDCDGYHERTAMRAFYIGMSAEEVFALDAVAFNIKAKADWEERVAAYNAAQAAPVAVEAPVVEVQDEAIAAEIEDFKVMSMAAYRERKAAHSQAEAVIEETDTQAEEAVATQDEETDPLKAEAIARYKERIEGKRSRYADLAKRKAQESQSLSDQAHRMGDAIPFGQPILIGHHSEKRDRNYRARIHNTYGKSYEAGKAAEHYEAKAEEYGTHGISADDPEAIDKLKAKLAGMESAQAHMVAVNKAVRACRGDREKIIATIEQMCFQDEIEALMRQEKLFRRPIRYPSYELTNNNANMARVRERIATLEAAKTAVGLDYTVEHNTQGAVKIYEEDNRICIHFIGRPSRPICDVLKHSAFKWAPSRGAWVRQATSNARYATKRAIAEILLLA